MQRETFFIPGLILVIPQVFSDERGSFFESFQEERYRVAGIPVDELVQENISVSHKGVLRGLHFQRPPYAQGKLVQVLQGSVFDVAVDLRSDSPTYGQHIALELSAKNHRQFFIPAGFAHGFLALEDDTVFHYKTTAVYDKASEGGVRYDDPTLAIAWPNIAPLIVADKDRALPTLASITTHGISGKKQ